MLFFQTWTYQRFLDILSVLLPFPALTFCMDKKLGA